MPDTVVPTYYVAHPDGSYTIANPQPVVARYNVSIDVLAPTDKMSHDLRCMALDAIRHIGTDVENQRVAQVMCDAARYIDSLCALLREN